MRGPLVVALAVVAAALHIPEGCPEIGGDYDMTCDFCGMTSDCVLQCEACEHIDDQSVATEVPAECETGFDGCMVVNNINGMLGCDDGLHHCRPPPPPPGASPTFSPTAEPTEQAPEPTKEPTPAPPTPPPPPTPRPLCLDFDQLEGDFRMTCSGCFTDDDCFLRCEACEKIDENSVAMEVPGLCDIGVGCTVINNQNGKLGCDDGQHKCHGVRTQIPTPSPTPAPSSAPTAHPTAAPTTSPTLGPTKRTPPPTANPTSLPTTLPSHAPTHLPTSEPTPAPTATPSFMPTATPTTQPTALPQEVLPLLAAYSGSSLSGFAVDTKLHHAMEKCVARTWTFQIQGPGQGGLRLAKRIRMTRMQAAAVCGPLASEGRLPPAERSVPEYKAMDGSPCFWNFGECAEEEGQGEGEQVQVELQLMLDVAGGPLHQLQHPRSQAFQAFVDGNATVVRAFERGVMDCLQELGHHAGTSASCRWWQLRRPRPGQRMSLCPYAHDGGVEVAALDDESCYPAPLGVHLAAEPSDVSYSLVLVLPLTTIICLVVCCAICYFQDMHRNADTVQKVNRPDNLDLMATDNVDFNAELDHTEHMHGIKSAPEHNRSPEFTKSVKAGVPLRALHSQQADYL